MDNLDKPATGELWSSVDSRFFARVAAGGGGGSHAAAAVWCFRGRSAVQGCVGLSQALQELLSHLETEQRRRGGGMAQSVVLVLASPETELPALLKACGDKGLRDRYFDPSYHLTSYVRLHATSLTYCTELLYCVISMNADAMYFMQAPLSNINFSSEFILHFAGFAQLCPDISASPGAQAGLRRRV